MPRSEKSLGYLCQKFVMLFLESPVSEQYFHSNIKYMVCVELLVYIGCLVLNF